MDINIATKIVEFIFTATGRNAIICNMDGVIVAAKVTSRIGSVHAGAQKMLREGLPIAKITVAEEEASGGTMRAGCNLPFSYKGEMMGSIGIAGDPEISELVTRMAAGLVAKEMQEREMIDALMDHATQMDRSITEIMATAERAAASQITVATEVDEVQQLITASFEDIQKTDEVIDTIQSIAGNTQMLGLNASIEAAHAREHGRGFSIVAEAVRKLSLQCSEAAESVKATQTHLQTSMSRVVEFSKDLITNAHAQTNATDSISTMVAELKRVSEALVGMTKS
jgi:hypothetical protein